MGMIYAAPMQRMLTGQLDLLGITIKAMLVSGYVPNVSHAYAATPAQKEMTCSGYLPGFIGSGRKTLTNVVINEIGGTFYLNADDISWTTLSGATATGCVIYSHNDSDSDSELLLYFDSGFPKTFDGGDFNLRWNDLGLLRLKQA